MNAADYRAFLEGAAFAGDGFNVPFDEAIAYHRQKALVPTADYKQAAAVNHDRAFVVSGVTNMDLLGDLKQAVDDAIAKGETLRTFQQKLDQAASKAGWLQGDHDAPVRAWRAKVIYETNLREAYQAGRWKQMRTPNQLRMFPFWQYRHGDIREPLVPRPAHVALDGMVFRADDPVWLKIYPPNGFFCSCGVRSLSARQLKRLGKDGPDPVPEIGDTFADPGFGHAPGADWAGGLTPSAPPTEPPAKAPDASPPGPDAQPPSDPSPPEGGAPAPERSGPKGAVAQMIWAARRFIAKFFGLSDAADLADAGDDANDWRAALFVDAAGLPMAISKAMFQTSAGEWVASRPLMDALPEIERALRDPDEIRLAWSVGPRPTIDRIYIRGDFHVVWGRRFWRWAAGTAPAGVTIWRKS